MCVTIWDIFLFQICIQTSTVYLQLDFIIFYCFRDVDVKEAKLNAESTENRRLQIVIIDMESK